MMYLVLGSEVTVWAVSEKDDHLHLLQQNRVVKQSYAILERVWIRV